MSGKDFVVGLLTVVTYILVHHPSQQDPRVAQVVESLETLSQCHLVDLYKDGQACEVNGAAHLRMKIGMSAVVGLSFLMQQIAGAVGLPLAVVLVLFCVPVYLLSIPLLIPFFIVLRMIEGWGFELAPTLTNGLRSFISPVKFLFSFLRYFSSFYSFLSSREKIDVIHCNDLETLLVGVYFKKLLGIRLVYDAHEYFPFQSLWLKGPGQIFLSFYEKILIQNVDDCFTVSKPIALAMTKDYNLSKQVVCVPNVFSKTLSVKNKRSKLGGPVKFVFIGSFIKERGIDFIIKQWMNLERRDGCLHLYGKSNPFHSYCMGLAKSSGLLNKTIFFHEAVKESQLIDVASYYDVGIIPYMPLSINNKYCCPNKLSQYMLAGNAILTNILPNVMSYIENYKNGLHYDYRDFKSFKSVVSQFAVEAKLTEMKENSQKRSQDNYNWELRGQSFKDLYREYNV